MPDARQRLLDECADKLKAAGAEVASILAQWPHEEPRTVVLVMSDGSKDPWKDKRGGKVKKRPVRLWRKTLAGEVGG
jgi:hypothetical protein